MVVFATVLVLIVSGIKLGAVSQDARNEDQILLFHETVIFSKPVIRQDDDGYFQVSLPGSNAQMTIPGSPCIPFYVQSFQLPKEAKNVMVTCTFSTGETIDLPGDIRPGSPFIPRAIDLTVDTSAKKNDLIYLSHSPFPETTFDYRVTCGRNNIGRIVTFVDVVCYPVRYRPALQQLTWAKETDITVSYTVPSLTTNENLDEFLWYDLLVIAPPEFTDDLQRLVDHKNSRGVDTIMKTTTEIYDEYTPLYPYSDKPELIKYFIKDALEQWGITYVLLVGGLKSYLYNRDKDDRNQGTIGWWVPVRYENIFLDLDPYPSDWGCISDLYYADIYKYDPGQGNVFDNWDSNNDGIYAALNFPGYPWDVLDLRPDVYLGRLPCRNKLELKIMINKIITYENTPPEKKPWLRRMVGIAGNTFDGGQNEGEIICNATFTNMSPLVDDFLTVYVSNNGTGGLRPLPDDITAAITRGAGYVMFNGHGNPYRWDTIWSDGSYANGDWAGGIKIADFWRFFNGRKLPVVSIGGCHNGLFNVSLVKTHLDHTHYFTHGNATPICFSWAMCIVPWGGAIASTGCTGYSLGGVTDFIERNLFYEIGQNQIMYLGQANSNAINAYISSLPMVYAAMAHCIAIWHVFGDPSLRLGGYP